MLLLILFASEGVEAEIQVKTEPDFGVMTSMICRLFPGAIDFLDDEDYVLTSDSDLIPIRKAYYQVQDYDAIGVWNGFCCGTFQLKNKTYEMYPMGHIGMKKKLWKEVMELKSGLTINSKLISDLVRERIDKKAVKQDKKISPGDQTWFADQIILSSRIQIYAAKKNMSILKRPYEGIRLSQPIELVNITNESFQEKTDFHAFKDHYMTFYPQTESLMKRRKVIFVYT